MGKDVITLVPQFKLSRVFLPFCHRFVIILSSFCHRFTETPSNSSHKKVLKLR